MVRIFLKIKIYLCTSGPDPEGMAFGRRSSTPVSTEDLQSSQQTTPKERRRFAFGFLDRKPVASGSNEAILASSSEAITPKTSTAPIAASAGSTTPTKSTLRSRMMEKFMGKSPSASSTPIAIDSKGNGNGNQISGSMTPPKRKLLLNTDTK